MIGSTLAKLWVDAGHEVRLASRHPENLTPLVERLGARASAGAPMEVATFGDGVMLAVPLNAVPDLARDLAPSLAGTVVLDTGNAYERRDGNVARLASQHPQGSAGWAMTRALSKLLPEWEHATYNTGMSGPELRTLFSQASPRSDRHA
jgi:predicted dinucleotide-binding enzyme